jgi:hypothetical protein
MWPAVMWPAVMWPAHTGGLGSYWM